MISNLNWRAITSPDTFQALVGMLVGFEDSGARTFDRAGRDAGQDAISTDGFTVFQAKFHSTDDPAQSFADARAELTKIAEYRKPENPCELLWRNVRRWVLVSPVAFNPADLRRWTVQIVPAFRAVGLDAEIWTISEMERRLAEHPQVVAHFFDGAALAFLPLPDARRLVSETDQIGGAAAEMVGRVADLETIVDFLASGRRILLLHGPGGIGKTRFLIEGCAQAALQHGMVPLWANVRALSSSLPLAGMIAERPTLVLADEPDKADQIDTLLGLLLGGQRTRGWKAIIAVRSPKDPVLQRLRQTELSPLVEEMLLNRLAPEPAGEMAAQLLGRGRFKDSALEWRENAATRLAEVADRFPIWIVFAARELERTGSLEALPKTAAELADQYIREILDGDPTRSPEAVEAVLRWVALLSPLNIEDSTALDLVVEYVRHRLNKPAWNSSDLRKDLDALVGRKVIFRRGAWDRLYEPKPDVLRDRVLDSWLLERQPRGLAPSADASVLLAGAATAALTHGVTPSGLRLLSAIGGLEMTHRLAGDRVALLDGFVTPLLDPMETLPANRVMRVLAALSAIAFYRPSTLIEVSRLLRNAAIPEAAETSLFTSRTIGRDDVLLALPWMLFDAARGATDPDDKRNLLRELLHLGAEEERIGPRRKYGLPNDGKRVSSVLPRIVVGGPEVLSDYGRESEAVAQEIVDELFRNPALDERLRTALTGLLRPLLTVEREHTVPEENYKITIQHYIIVPGSEAWRARSNIMDGVRRVLTLPSCPQTTASALWKLLADAHRSLLSGVRTSGANYPEVGDAVIEELTWTRDTLRERERDPKELNAAREMWDWHRRFDPNPERKHLANECEELMEQHPSVRELGPLLTVPWDDDWLTRIEAKADELKTKTPDQIARFVAAAEEYGAERGLDAALNVAGALGYRAHANSNVLRLTEWVSTASPDSAQFRFAANVIRNRLRKLREVEGSAVALAELQNRCTAVTEGQPRARLWSAALSRLTAPPLGNLSTEEVIALRTAHREFEIAGELGSFLTLITENCWVDWPGFQELVSTVLGDSRDERAARLAQVVHAMDFARFQLKRANPPGRLPTNAGRWVLDQLVLVEDIDDVDATTLHLLRGILEDDERPTPAWVVSVINARRQAVRPVDVVPTHYRLSSFAKPTSADSVTHDEESAIRALISSVAEDEIGYAIPEYVRELDPDGVVVVPAIVESTARAAVEPDELWPLARIAGAYPEQSKPWRDMAAPLCGRVLTAKRETRISIFGVLEGRRMRSYSSAIGEVAAVFHEEVAAARKALEDETDAALREYWRWRLAAAEAELEAETQRVREDRRE